MESNYAAGWRAKAKIFTLLENTCKETKLKEFQFKLIHRIVVPNRELFRYLSERMTNASIAVNAI